MEAETPQSAAGGGKRGLRFEPGLECSDFSWIDQVFWFENGGEESRKLLGSSRAADRNIEIGFDVLIVFQNC